MGVQSLLRHPPLLPGESLSSFLARLAKVNHYEPRSILFALVRESGKFKPWSRLGSPSQASQFQYIETLTNITSHDLYKATDHRFAPTLTPPENEITYLELTPGLSIPLLSKGIAQKHLRPEYAGQFCPLCLKEAIYHRLIWLPLASAVCLDHECLLVNLCPKCEKRITIQDIVGVNCSECKTDLTEAQVVSVEMDSFGLFTQNLIQSWLMKGANFISPVYSLPQQTSRDLYRVIDGIRLSTMQVNQDWSLLHRPNLQLYSLMSLPDIQAATLTPYQSYCLYATACKGIIDWPNGFHQFLTAYRNREKRSRYRNKTIFNGVSDELGNLYVNWLNKHWRQPTLEFVQDAFHQYLVDNNASFPATILLDRYKYDSQLSNGLCYMSINETAKILGVTHARLRLMIRSGRLKSYNEEGKSWATLVRREDVAELQEKWDKAIRLKEVMNWLGLSKKVVLQLVQIGLLTAQQSHAEGFHWMFNPSSVDECLERVLRRSQEYEPENNKKEQKMLSLNNVSDMLTQRLPSGQIAFILQEIVDGRINAYFPKNQIFRLGTLLFFHDDINTYVEAIKAEKGWIGPDEAARILEIDRQSIAKWIKTGLITPIVTCKRCYYFDKQTIKTLKSDLVLCAEAKTILGIRREGVQDLVRQGRIKAIRGPMIDGYGHYVFSRKELLQWRSTRITLRETSQLLQVNKHQIVVWVKQGKIPLPENEKQKPWFFSLQALNVYKRKELKRKNALPKIP